MNTSLTINDTVKESIMIALIRLMNTKDIKEISITEIVNLAGVSRTSFYRNFESKEQVLVDYLNLLYSQFFESETILRKVSKPSEIYQFCLPRFQFVKKNKDFFIALQKNNCLSYAFEHMNTQLLFFMNGLDESIDRYYFAGIVGSCVGIIYIWIKDGFNKSPEELAQEFISSNCFRFDEKA